MGGLVFSWEARTSFYLLGPLWMILSLFLFFFPLVGSLSGDRTQAEAVSAPKPSYYTSREPPWRVLSNRISVYIHHFDTCEVVHRRETWVRTSQIRGMCIGDFARCGEFPFGRKVPICTPSNRTKIELLLYFFLSWPI